MKEREDEMLSTHPCYCENAHTKYARMHIPVAPACNIQCNYCNRKYDCSNESRPGVTSEVLSPEEAVEKIRIVKEKIPNLSVIGIAGPGDPLANENTFRALELISKKFPDLTLCLSTNGLMLPANAQRLYDLGVRFVTVTMNAADPKIASEIYEHVIWNGKKYTGTEGAKILIDNQLDGIKKCAAMNMKVKVNVVMIPGINDAHIPELAKIAKDSGAFMVNILPLIPVEGTKFEDLRAPTAEERRSLTDRCEINIKMMRHCRQCRADAIGLLDEDRSEEFVKAGSCRSGCGPSGTHITEMVPFKTENYVAVASSDGIHVDRGFGNSEKFYIFSADPEKTEPLKTEYADTSSEVTGTAHRDHLMSVTEKLKDCDIIVVKEIGSFPRKILESSGKKVVITDSDIRTARKSLENNRKL